MAGRRRLPGELIELSDGRHLAADGGVFEPPVSELLDVARHGRYLGR